MTEHLLHGLPVDAVLVSPSEDGLAHLGETARGLLLDPALTDDEPVQDYPAHDTDGGQDPHGPEEVQGQRYGLPHIARRHHIAVSDGP